MLSRRDPVAKELAQVIRAGQVDQLRSLLAARPELASARLLGGDDADAIARTPLHVATDWPGYFPHAPETVAILLDAGADIDADTGGARPETALHWAASSDDVDVAVVLVDRGADVEKPGGSIGTPLDNAVAYACWHVARLLVERGATVQSLWQAAALGLLTRMEELLAETAPEPEAVSQAFWHACAGGQRRAAERLVAAGAQVDWRPEYAPGSALDAVTALSARRHNLVDWLRALGP